MPRISPPALALIVAFAWTLAATPPALATTDLRIQLNPALAEIYDHDPVRAEKILDALNRIIEGKTAHNPPPTTRSIDDPNVRSLIDGNPLLEEAWRIDPKAALDQLREIVAAGGGS